MATPRVIHFIWAGGEKPFPNDEVLQKWQAKNPDCQIILWVDKKSTPDEVFTHYKKDLNYEICGEDETPDVDTVINQQTGARNTTPKPIVCADISDAGVSSPHIRYEIDRLNRNYGCSSDLLRYNILAKYGGAYFDSDIDPGDLSLNDVIDFDSNEDLFKVTGYTQKKLSVGNDAFICSPNNQYMEGLAKFAEDNYAEEYLNDPDDYSDPKNVMNITLGRTGPSCVEEHLKKQKLVKENPYKKDLPVDNILLDRRLYKSHTHNDLNWLNTPIKSSDRIEDALNTAVDSILFEDKHMNISRIRAHTREIISSLRSDFDKELQKFNKFCFDKLFDAQMTTWAERYNEAELKQKAFEETLKIIDKNIDSRKFIPELKKPYFSKCLKANGTDGLKKLVFNLLVKNNQMNNLYNASADNYFDQYEEQEKLKNVAFNLKQKFENAGVALYESRCKNKKDIMTFDIRNISEALNLNQPEPTPIEQKIASELVELVQQEKGYGHDFTKFRQSTQDNKLNSVKMFVIHKDIDVCKQNIEATKAIINDPENEKKYEFLKDFFNTQEQELRELNIFYDQAFQWWADQTDRMKPDIQKTLNNCINKLEGHVLEIKRNYLIVRLSAEDKDPAKNREFIEINKKVSRLYNNENPLYPENNKAHKLN